MKRRRVSRRTAPVPQDRKRAPAIADPARHVHDAELVGRCLVGDESAWDELLRRHRPLVISIAARHGLRGDAAEDIYQATCVTMLERLELLRDHRSLAAWVATTVARKCWRRRAERGLVELPADRASDGPLLEAALVEARQLAAVREALDEMPEPCRSLLRELFVDDLAHADVARRHGIAVGSVGVYRRRCLDRLAKRLRARGWLPEEEGDA